MSDSADKLTTIFDRAFKKQQKAYHIREKVGELITQGSDESWIPVILGFLARIDEGYTEPRTSLIRALTSIDGQAAHDALWGYVASLHESSPDVLEGWDVFSPISWAIGSKGIGLENAKRLAGYAKTYTVAETLLNMRLRLYFDIRPFRFYFPVIRENVLELARGGIAELREFEWKPERPGAEDGLEQWQERENAEMDLCDSLLLLGLSDADDDEVSDLLDECAQIKGGYVSEGVVRAALCSGRALDAEYLENALNDQRQRWRLVETALELGREHEIPAHYLTQEQQAISHIASWCAHGMEYGYIFDKIEVVDTRMVRVVREQTGEAVSAPQGEPVFARAYLFRYFYPDWVEYHRKNHPEAPESSLGWKAGITGPFPEDQSELSMLPGPLNLTFGYTEPFELMSIEEHYRSFHLEPLD